MNRLAYLCWLMSLLQWASSPQAMPTSKCMETIGSIVSPPRLSPELSDLFKKKAYPVIKANSLRLTRKYKALRMEPEDFISEATLHILEAAQMGKIDLVAATPTYINKNLEWMMANRLREYQRLPDEQIESLDASPHPDSIRLLDRLPNHGSEQAALDKAERGLYQRRIELLVNTLHGNAMKRIKTEGFLMSPNLSNLQGGEETWRVLKAIVELHASKELTNRDVAMLFAYHVDRRKLQEISEEFGVSSSRTSRIIKAAVEKIQRQVAAEKAPPRIRTNSKSPPAKSE